MRKMIFSLLGVFLCVGCAATEYQPYSAGLATVPATYLPSATLRPTIAETQTPDPAIAARQTLQQAEANAAASKTATAEKMLAAATATALARASELDALSVISASLALSQTKIAAIQTEILVRSQIMSATEEFFVSPLRVQATQTAIAASAHTEQQMGMAWSALAWGVVIGLLVGFGCVLYALYVALKSGKKILWRLIDAKVRIHENTAADKEADTWLKINRPAPAAQPIERHILDEEANRKAWYENMWNFFSWGIEHNTFVNSDMDEEGASIISNINWCFVTRFYIRQKVLMHIKGKTALGVGWSKERIRQEMDAKTFPYPIGEPPVLVASSA